MNHSIGFSRRMTPAGARECLRARQCQGYCAGDSRLRGDAWSDDFRDTVAERQGTEGAGTAGFSNPC